MLSCKSSAQKPSTYGGSSHLAGNMFAPEDILTRIETLHEELKMKKDETEHLRHKVLDAEKEAEERSTFLEQRGQMVQQQLEAL